MRKYYIMIASIMACDPVEARLNVRGDFILDDFNQDGFFEYVSVIGKPGGNNDISVLQLNESFQGENFLFTQTTVPANEFIIRINSGDFNRDGFLDLVGIYSNTEQTEITNISILLNNKNNGFEEPRFLPFPPLPITSNPLGLFEPLNPFALGFIDEETFIVPDYFLFIEDFDIDGDFDIIVNHGDENGNNPILFKNDGVGNLTEATILFPQTVPYFLMDLEDINDDGVKEFLGGFNDEIALIRNNGAGSFLIEKTFLLNEEQTPVYKTFWSKLNIDKETDIMLVSRKNNQFDEFGKVSLLFGKDAFEFEIQETDAQVFEPFDVGPINNDSLDDIFYARVEENGDAGLVKISLLFYKSSLSGLSKIRDKIVQPNFGIISAIDIRLINNKLIVISTEIESFLIKT